MSEHLIGMTASSTTVHAIGESFDHEAGVKAYVSVCGRPVARLAGECQFDPDHRESCLRCRAAVRAEATA